MLGKKWGALALTLALLLSLSILPAHAAGGDRRNH